MISEHRTSDFHLTGLALSVHREYSAFSAVQRFQFKTITADNSSEFANLSQLVELGVGIYFTHPYTSCEKELLNAITVCFGVSSRKEKALMIIQLMRY